MTEDHRIAGQPPGLVLWTMARQSSLKRGSDLELWMLKRLYLLQQFLIETKHSKAILKAL